MMDARVKPAHDQPAGGADIIPQNGSWLTNRGREFTPAAAARSAHRVPARPGASATNGLMSTDVHDVFEVDGEAAERDQRVHDCIDVERGRCRDSPAAACAPRMRASMSRALSALTGGAQNVTSLTSSSSTPPLPAMTTRPISGSRWRPSTSSTPPRIWRQTSMPAMLWPASFVCHAVIGGRQLLGGCEIERDRAQRRTCAAASPTPP